MKYIDKIRVALANFVRLLAEAVAPDEDEFKSYYCKDCGQLMFDKYDCDCEDW